LKVLVTGSSGLIGSEAVLYYDGQGHEVYGVDNNMRAVFFGPKGDTTWNLDRLKTKTKKFKSFNVDIRDKDAVFSLFKENNFDLVIHCASQPSHDKAREIPLIDFEVNALGTVYLLEATRQHAPDAVFIHMSTNKVYGDSPNELPLKELETRYDYADPKDYNGISDTQRIDRCLHSLFGASKASSDIVAQEYGRYFGLKVGIFRGGCITGPSHSAVELHGFLSYLVKVALSGEYYTVYGYKGKQVRDNIHSCDMIQAFEAFRSDPKSGEVYNIGGGRQNSISVIEAITMIEKISGKKINWSCVNENRIGDHICYISDLSKLKAHFPAWKISRSLESIIDEMVHAAAKLN
jgi:CDP-paratose 2-epimerase